MAGRKNQSLNDEGWKYVSREKQWWNGVMSNRRRFEKSNVGLRESLGSRFEESNVGQGAAARLPAPL